MMISATNKMQQNLFVDSFKLALPPNLCHRSAADNRVGTLFQKAIYTVKVLLKMGETIARKI